MADITLHPEAFYILKNHVVGRRPTGTPINEYLLYDEALKLIQTIHCTVTEIKAVLPEDEPPTPVSAAWLHARGAFNGKR